MVETYSVDRKFTRPDAKYYQVYREVKKINSWNLLWK
jgi:hypothetical protein